IGGVIDRLEQKGYISRHVSKHDRRAREVRLTKKGTRVYDQILPIVTAFQDDILPGLNRTERTRFLELAGKAIATLSDETLPERT
ncbi:MAG: MarR family transcriptional regulator, partial [Proteobacteria bacterium]|nr:MarR family transcriptional regulator [Pseudomonadota bacterium]